MASSRVPAVVTLVGYRGVENKQVSVACNCEVGGHPGKETPMTSSKHLTLPVVAIAGALSLSAASVARAGEAPAAPATDAQQLQQQIEQLQAKVAQLESKQQVLATRDVDATVESVLKDADKRSQLLQMEGFTAGWTKDKGFRIQDAAGNWVLHPMFQFQFRSTTNFRDEGKHGGDDNDIENGFEIRRLKIGFDGNAFTPDLYYYFLWNTDSGGSLGLEQAYVKYFFADDWAFRVGQIVNPAFHEQTTSSKFQLAADRSLANRLLTGTNEAFTQAFTVQYDSKDSPIWAEVGLEDGFVSGNTDFVDTNEGGANDWGVTARVNWFVKGDKKAYNDFTAMGNKEDLLVIGFGGDVTQAGDATSYLHTVDVQWENTNGLGIYAAYIGDYINDDGADEDFYNWGALVQAGYMLNDRWEIFGRYDYTDFDGDFASGDNSFNEATIGLNYYVGGGHNAKVTVDFTWLPDGAPSDINSLGILQSGEDEYMIRGQFQLLL